MTKRISPFLILALVACGDDGVHHLADSGVDSSQPQPDAPPDAPQLGMVTVTVTLENNTTAGVQVYFQNADSSLVSSTTTGSDGTASAMMAAGGFVTVLEPVVNNTFGSVTNVNNQQVDTFSGVKPGDNLHVDVDPNNNTVDIADVTFTIPLDGSAVQYDLFSTCSSEREVTPSGGSGSAIPNLIEMVGCGGTADVLVVTADDLGNPLDAMFQPAVVIADGSSVTLTQTYAPVTEQAFGQTNVPGTVGDVETEVVLATSHGFLFESQFDDESPTGGSDAETVGVPAVTGAIAANLSFYRPTGLPIDEQVQLSWGPQTSGAVDTDYSTVRLRSWVTRAQFDVVTGQVEWSVEKTPGATPDAVVTHIGVDREDPTNGFSDWTWNIAAAGATDGAVPVPTLPTDIFDFNIHDTDSSNVFETKAFTAPGGYDAARATVFDIEQEINNDPEGFVTTAGSGQLYIQEANGGGEGLKAAKHARPHRRGHGPTLQKLMQRHATSGHGIGIVSSLFPALRSTR